MMLSIKRTTAQNKDFIDLVRLLDIELAEIDGEEHGFYSQYNKIDKINHVVLLYENELAIACGAIKEYALDTMEVKRMYTHLAYRGKGIASRLLKELEKWAKELGYKKCLLETGKRQEDAVALYRKNDYQHISNYGQYVGIENSICFQKIL
ncbi:GNAT family N-acetyltransferase [Pedobacter sp. ASV28]|uniref:GNAT family N-acetyltransferase n=1 Tax=Pedobacter sp. ASV28 TaxID=2795123 RepID=UPI0018EE0A7B|nr:GNAT family N-acetyltransferase [Pedobacter sp. ASV28]